MSAEESAQGPEPVLAVADVHKTFRLGFVRKKVEAVRGVSFEVRRGEIFGLLGPNGAGKTTTIKSILRLIFPDRGSIRIFGEPSQRRRTMRRVGYMPENPYVYQYLRPLEFLDLCGRLMGMGGRERRARGEAILGDVGLMHALDRPIGKFSKGMMQRVGLAQALLHDPDLLVLDEPMSGLDPIGRKQMRDLLVAQREKGKTLLFTSHILSDVEMLCDRVAILRRGRVAAEGSLDRLLRPEVRRVDVALSGVDSDLRLAFASEEGIHVDEGGVDEGSEEAHLIVEGEGRLEPILRKALDSGAKVHSVLPRRETLEDLFVRDAMKEEAPASPD